MKVSCPNCKKVLQAPDKWAGRKVKCPACKKPIALPEAADEQDDLDFDLGSLGSIEDAGEAVVHERKGKPMSLKQAQAEHKAKAVEEAGHAPASDPRIRTCPKCGQKSRHDDVYSELMCRQCGTTIPGADLKTEKTAVKYTSTAGRIVTKTSFYTGFTAAAFYPIGAIDSILKAMGIALACIVVPVGGILAFTQSSSLNSLTEKTGDTAAWVGPTLAVAFLAEAIYFGSVAYYALIDTIRTTTAGSEKTATLTWNPINLGAALGGYVALIVFYALVVIGLVGGVPASFEDVQRISAPWKLILLALLTFGVPMNIIGLSSSHASTGLTRCACSNPSAGWPDNTSSCS